MSLEVLSSSCLLYSPSGLAAGGRTSGVGGAGPSLAGLRARLAVDCREIQR